MTRRPAAALGLATPTKGDCVTAPVRQVHARGTFTLAG